MSNFSALKTAIQNAIKQNGNEEITGNLLQGILLSIVETLGDSAINTLETGLSNEATTRGNADTQLNNLITQLSNLITGVKNNVDNGYVYAGIATPSTTPVSGKVFYIALQAGTYTNFGGTTVTEGITILKYNGTSWVKEQVLFTDGGVFDISANHATGGTLAKYADLTAALGTSGANIPEAIRKGGMSVKYVQSSDNKYVQYRLMSDTFSTTESDWQGVDDVPTAGSDNLTKSGGVANELTKISGNVYYKFTNHVVAGNGTLVDTTTRITSNAIKGPVTLKVKSGYLIRACAEYSTSEISSWITNDPLHSGSGILNVTEVTYPNNDYVRFVVTKEDSSTNISPSDDFLDKFVYNNSLRKELEDEIAVVNIKADNTQRDYNQKVSFNKKDANAAIPVFFLDTSNYQGSADISNIYIRQLFCGNSNYWGITLNDKNFNFLAELFIIQENAKPKKLEGVYNGIYIYAEFNWDATTIGTATNFGGTCKVTPFAYLGNYNEFYNVKKGISTSQLFGKKVACIGDSITFGRAAGQIAVADSNLSPLNVDAGRTNANKTYGYLLAKYCGIDWYNYGIDGSTMGDCNSVGDAHHNGFSKENGRYTQMAADIDYFIIMFGENDLAYGAYMKAEDYVEQKYGARHMYPVDPSNIGASGYMTQEEYDDVSNYSGEISGQTYTGLNYFRHQYIGRLYDNTNKTWCGAWNIVLDYIFVNYVNPKVIIWINPTSTTLDESTKAIATRWGLPYIDMQDDNVPTVWRKQGPESIQLSNGVWFNSFSSGRNITIRDRCTADGLHPNAVGYEFIIPTFIEKLKSV